MEFGHISSDIRRTFKASLLSLSSTLWNQVDLHFQISDISQAVPKNNQMMAWREVKFAVSNNKASQWKPPSIASVTHKTYQLRCSNSQFAKQDNYSILWREEINHPFNCKGKIQKIRETRVQRKTNLGGGEAVCEAPRRELADLPLPHIHDGLLMAESGPLTTVVVHPWTNWPQQPPN